MGDAAFPATPGKVRLLKARHAPCRAFLYPPPDKPTANHRKHLHKRRNAFGCPLLSPFKRLGAFVSEGRGVEFYRQRAEDMRHQAERAISPHLRETYLRIALDWERMAEQLEAKSRAKPEASRAKSS
jgi:hypothetical protein